jgi:hypothetical protein
MENISLEDYIDLVRDNERLRAENAVLQTQLELTKKFYEDKGLADPGAVAGSKTAEIIKELAPSALGLLSEFMNQQSMKLDLEEKKLSLKPTGTKIKRSNIETVDYLKNQLTKALQEEDQNKIDLVLDNIYEKYPNLYESILEEYNLSEEEEEEETE